MRNYFLRLLVCVIVAVASTCMSQNVASDAGTLSGLARSSFMGDESAAGRTRICVPELENVSTRSVNLNFLRERLIKLLQKKTVTALPSEGTATDPDYAQARDAGCTYMLKVEVRELRLKTTEPGITFGSPRIPDVKEPESLNKRYTARLDYELTRMGENEPVVDSVANGESDTEMQAAAGAADFVASRVLAELKKK
jgi:hypothetical protein